jgi:signal transduction histidine kinase
MLDQKNESEQSLENNKKRKPRWFYAYIFLALFDLVTVLVSLFLNDQIINIYQSTAEQNKQWAVYQENLTQLSELALIANTIGNDLFESKNLESEQSKYAQARVALIEHHEATINLLKNSGNGDQTESIVAFLESAKNSIGKLDSEVTTIFAEYGQGNITEAASHMSLMDRRYAELASELASAAKETQHIQLEYFESQNQLAQELRFYELVIAGCILFMVFGAGCYGNALTKRIQEDEDKKHEIETKLIEYAKELEKEKERAETANRLKSDFLAKMSHELRTPMNGILGMAQILENTELSEAQQKHIQVIRNSGDGLLFIINDILDLSKIESEELQLEEIPFDLYAKLNEVWELFHGQAEAKGIELRRDYDKSSTLALTGDPLRLKQIVLNLVSNAIKFTDTGHVAIEVSESLAPDNTALIQLKVIDTGDGIEASVQDFLFDPFKQANTSTTRKSGGTGLGLAICKQLAELMNGSVTLDSEIGKGSVFTLSLSLPLAKEEANKDSESHDSSGENVKLTGNVLVADDAELNQVVIESILELVGVDVTLVDNGRKALDVWQSGDFDLILMDCEMPEMDGYTATKEIRKLESDSHIPIVALTANAYDENKQRCLESGMDDFLTKPIDTPVLLRLLEHYLGQ